MKTFDERCWSIAALSETIISVNWNNRLVSTFKGVGSTFVAINETNVPVCLFDYFTRFRKCVGKMVHMYINNRLVLVYRMIQKPITVILWPTYVFRNEIAFSRAITVQITRSIPVIICEKRIRGRFDFFSDKDSKIESRNRWTIVQNVCSFESSGTILNCD